MVINIEKIRKEIEKSVCAPKKFEIYTLKISDQIFHTADNKMFYTCQIVIKYTEKRKICGKRFLVVSYDVDKYLTYYIGIENIFWGKRKWKVINI